LVKPRYISNDYTGSNLRYLVDLLHLDFKNEVSSMNKKAAMEMGKLIGLILVAVLLIFLLIWYGFLAEGEGGLGSLLDRLLNF
jgi:hypothetical protein